MPGSYCHQSVFTIPFPGKDNGICQVLEVFPSDFYPISIFLQRSIYPVTMKEKITFHVFSTVTINIMVYPRSANTITDAGGMSTSSSFPFMMAPEKSFGSILSGSSKLL